MDTKIESKSSKFLQKLSFFYGGIACCVAAVFTHPIDTIKIRLQLNGELAAKGNSNVISNMIRSEGIVSLWRGLSASVLREASYSTIRMGLYQPFKTILSDNEKVEPLWKKIAAGGLSGMIGAAIANPTDLIKVRFQASAAAGHVTIWSTVRDIVSKEGIPGLYRGVGPTTQRAIIVTAAQLSSYDHSKRLLIDAGHFHEGIMVHFASSMIAGFVCATASSPVDVVKSRYMNQKFTPEGKGLLYSSSYDCMIKTVKAEGPIGLFKGWLPSWLRLGPHTIITFIVLEQLRKVSGVKPM
ncbi:mitochondrial carrier domain-containing protein [Globomyces pollinis-pini]|nr:mitochondrial carrier domain-containing protein [Globomyces pollinis-pini]